MRVWYSGILVALALVAQTPDVVPAAPATTPPRLLHKVEPEYSAMACADHIQGTVVYQIFVDEQGRPADITVISPVGFGLDERGQAAIAKWRFKPGEKNGVAVRVRATVEVNFRFPAIWFDEKAEKRRTAYNLALQDIKQKEEKPRSAAVKSIQALAAQNYPPAMYTLGTWETTGVNVEQNSVEGWMLIEKSAANDFGPALYQVAQRQLESDPNASQTETALETMRQAAVLGSTQAQYYLGHRYEKGLGVPPDATRARRYFRPCATRGVAQCQARLGNLMLHEPGVADYDYEQAAAWLQLAADQGLPDARQVAAQEEAKLNPKQLKSVLAWRGRLALKP